MYAVSFWREAQPHQDSQTLQFFVSTLDKYSPSFEHFSLILHLWGNIDLSFADDDSLNIILAYPISILYMMSKSRQISRELANIYKCYSEYIFAWSDFSLFYQAHVLSEKVSSKGRGCYHHGHLHH